jgi:glutamate synthase (NADPH/NADH) small chain
MEQQHLRDLEYQCIQEQPPECTAACPIHLDARTFVRHVSNGAWNDAWKTLRRTMPFPGILGRICDAPCQDHCKRGDVGDPIQIHALEKKCVSMTPPRQNVLPLPARDKRVAVIGGGLSGLTVAWDLCRKGYLVEIFDPNPRLGHYLITYYPDALPPEVVDEELALLNKLKVRINLETDLDDPNFPEKCLNEFDAVFLSFEAVDSESWGLDKDAGGKVVVEIPMQRTSHEKIFAGGWDDSPIRRAAQGRWAATSMDRYLQNVSMTAGRKKTAPLKPGCLPVLKVSRQNRPSPWPNRNRAIRMKKPLTKPGAACNANAWSASRSVRILSSSGRTPRNTPGKSTTTNPCHGHASGQQAYKFMQPVRLVRTGLPQ